ncbi:hypothetical protein [Halocatena salina]|uniref:Uncharacterized protein n=1 Tax=Halocatena salina TaxID=2934340 RepID=A0A8U0A9S2_9EURY|nr:hypothetical protein [Halocatena salina]UPM45208.1 hypothetical protein MW046_17820 [Halocatena salina]
MAHDEAVTTEALASDMEQPERRSISRIASISSTLLPTEVDRHIVEGNVNDACLYLQ